MTKVGLTRINYYENEMEEIIMEETRIPLTERRLLDINNFQIYAGVGRTSALSLAKESGAVVRIGRRFLVDRVKFDTWCDDQI